jgi:glycosyltransferase involved in cell wall biosynthesis
MLVSCLCVCHNKPDIIPEAIRSLLNQTYPDWEAVVVDSGVLYDTGYYDRFAWRSDPRIRLFRSHETAETRRTRAMAPWCFNECFRRGLVRGELVMYLCDDDVLYPRAFETFVGYCRNNPGARAMYASQDVGVIYPNGWHAIVGERRADRPGGRCCRGRPMDSQVDYLQFCHKTDVLKMFPRDEYWPEAKDTEEHADGLFMERVGERVPIHAIDVKVSQNRRTARSTYTAPPPLALLDCLANGVPVLPAREYQAAGPEEARPEEETPLVTVSVVGHNRGAALADALAALAAQTYPHLEVLVIDDGSTDESLRSRHPQYRFLHQGRAGDHGLAEARGAYFVPLRVDHLACPDMVERLVARVSANPCLSAVTCYLLKPGGALKDVSGPALFRTADLRAAGGFDMDPDIAGGDWSIFFKLVNGGRQVDILPEHLARSHRAEAPQAFLALDRASAEERVALWTALAGRERRLEELARENAALRSRLGLLRYRIADRLDALLARVPLLRGGLKRLAGLIHRFAKR